MTTERDAKEKARRGEELARDKTERELATGLLRPIGFANRDLDTGELHSFVEWSAIKESRLKSRVFAAALDDPQTALRAARRAERVIQSCVGLSPRRRAKAIELVSAKQRDLAADPRIRVAASWLALELGSADLPAWRESVRYLSSQRSIEEFLDFAITRRDPRQIGELSMDPLISLVETSTDLATSQYAWYALLTNPQRLDRAQFARTLDALVSRLEKTWPDFYSLLISTPSASAIDTFAARMSASQSLRVAEAVLVALEKLPGGDSSVGAQLSAARTILTPLVSRLQAAQVSRAAQTLNAFLDRIRDGDSIYVGSHWNDLTPLLDGLAVLAARLPSADAAHTADTVTALAVKTSAATPSGIASGFAAIVPLLDQAHVERIADSLIGAVPAQLAIEELTAIAPRIRPDQAERAWTSVLPHVSRFYPQNAMAGLPDAAPDALLAFAPRLQLRQAQKAGDAMIAALEKSSEYRSYGRALIALIALAPRLEPNQLSAPSTF